MVHFGPKIQGDLSMNLRKYSVPWVELQRYRVRNSKREDSVVLTSRFFLKENT